MTITKSPRMGLTVESDTEYIDPFPDNWPILDNYAGVLLVANGVTPDPLTLFDGSVVAEATSGIMWMADFSSGSLVKRYLTYPFEANCGRSGYSVPNGPNGNQPIPMNLPAPNGYTNAVSVNWDNDLATTTGRVKVPIAGIYLVTAQVITGHSSTGSRGLYLQVNGTEQIQVINLALTAGNTIFQACILRKLAANDLVGISYWQNSGVAGGTDFNLNVSLVSPL